MSEDLVSKKVQLREAFAQAEECMKKYEVDHVSVLDPCINELRYAGKHTIDAMIYEKDGENEKAISCIDKAIGHCHRARYDAVEASLLHCFALMDNFRKSYENIVISEVLPNYPDERQRANELRAKCKTIVQESYQKNSKEYYVEEIQELLAPAQTICDSWKNAVDDLNIKKKEKQFYKNVAVISVIGIIFSSITAVIAIIVAIMK